MNGDATPSPADLAEQFDPACPNCYRPMTVYRPDPELPGCGLGCCDSYKGGFPQRYETLLLS
jgi:hypothetical protein